MLPWEELAKYPECTKRVRGKETCYAAGDRAEDVVGIGGHGIGLSGCTCYRLDYNAQVVGRDTDGKAESFGVALKLLYEDYW